MLDLSKLEAGRMKLEVREIDIVRVMKTYINTILSSAELKGITVDFISQNESVNLYIDIDKADKVAMNLFSNALKFTDRGGGVLRPHGT